MPCSYCPDDAPTGGRTGRRVGGNAAEMVAQAGVIAWLTGIAALSAVTIWSGLEAVAHAFASVGWGIALVVMVRAVTVCGGRHWLVAAVPVENASTTSNMHCAAPHSRGRQCPVADGADRRRPHRRRTADPLCRSARARGRQRHRRCPRPGGNAVSVCGRRACSCSSRSEPTRRWRASPPSGSAWPALLLAAFYLAQRDGGHRILRSAIGRLAGDRKWRMLGSINSLYQNLAAIYAARSHLAASIVVHMAGWIFGVAEVLIVFACMGIRSASPRR